MTTFPELAALIHRQGKQFVLAMTGGGSRAISELLEVPGASRTVLEAIVPYSSGSLVRWLGAKPDRNCAPRTARAMAMAAFQRALEYSAPDADPRRSNLLGLGCTASLASDRPKRGAHRIHVALQSSSCTATRSLELASGARTRKEEEALAATLVLNLLAESVGSSERLELALSPEEHVQSHETRAPVDWQDLLLGLAEHVCVGPAPPIDGRRAIFPGAFNPLHDGHRRMAEFAQRRLAVPVEFEIAVWNVDKPPLDFTEMHDRAAQFTADQFMSAQSCNQPTLWFTRAAAFVEKSRFFPKATFIVGLDTIVRIGQPRYYGDNAAACRQAIEQIGQRGGRFLVFGRADASGFRSLSHVQIPLELAALCDEVRESEFREDISSSEIRGRA